MRSGGAVRASASILDDRTGRIEVTLFDEIFQRHRDLIVKDALVLIEGTVRFDEFSDGWRLAARRIADLDQVLEAQARRIVLKWPSRMRSGADFEQARADPRALSPRRLPGHDRIPQRAGAAAALTLGARLERARLARACWVSCRACSAARLWSCASQRLRAPAPRTLRMRGHARNLGNPSAAAVALRMAVAFLDFEQPIAELEAKIEELKHITSDSEVNIRDEITRLQAKSRQLTTHIFASLTPWQITQLARHPHRPYTLDYVNVMCSDFQELHGDRMFGDDLAIVGGLARLGERAVMVLGHQKGRDTKERVRRNYGMPKPEGYRKAMRLMRLAERFGLPLITFIDTPGAYPGVGSEERGQSEAIARNLFEMSLLRIPIITVVIGEGGSGGALAIGVCDRLLMLQYSTYSVITPEGCASILWKSAEKKEAAADAMGLTAQRLAQLGLIDEVLEEPLGGAHRDPVLMSERLKEALMRQLASLDEVSREELRDLRGAKIAAFGVYSELPS